MKKSRIAAVLLGMQCLFGSATAIAQVKVFWISLVILFVAAAALVAVFSFVISLVQLIAKDEMRGRVMSVYNVAFRGGMPFGSLTTGYFIPLFSVPTVLAINGGLLACLGLYFLIGRRDVSRLE